MPIILLCGPWCDTVVILLRKMKPATSLSLLWLVLLSVTYGKFPTASELNGFIEANSMKIKTLLLHQLSLETTRRPEVDQERGFKHGGQWVSLHWRKMYHILRCLHERFDIQKNEMEELLSVLHGAPTDPSLLWMNITALDQCPYGSIECDADRKYRTNDGSCNNLANPYWGKALTPLLNNLAPDYGDGCDGPRKASSGNDLPSARELTLKIFTDKDQPSPTLSFLFMTYGQLLAHDTGLTGMAVVFQNTNLDGGHMITKCGGDGCLTDDIENEGCFPIPLPSYEPHFQNKTCLKFVRSLPVPELNCKYGFRKQLNQITSFIDASFVYGSTDAHVASIRSEDSKRGSLKTSIHPQPHWQPLLPTTHDVRCKDLNDTVKCFLTGDPRANEHITLVSIHTAFVRLHNQIEAKLLAINPHWKGEKLFQETRKIVAAIVQHISYNEYLPLVLGDDMIRAYNLTLLKNGYWNGYDPMTRPDVSNSFQTAAFRFGHSLIANSFRLMDNKSTSFHDVWMTKGFFRPHEIYSSANGAGFDQIIYGMAIKPSQLADRHFPIQVTSCLFTKFPPHGLGEDLTSLNVQRGRDHGLSGYNHYRRWCNLPTGKSFSDLPDIPDDVKQTLADLYEDVADIDLFVGGMVENLLPGASVGPTFGCIIARQFLNLRKGDRFWYETNDPDLGFTEPQLSEIRKARLARILCDVSDDIKKIHPWVLLQPNDGLASCGNTSSACKFNKIMPCSEFAKIDLNKWKEISRANDIDL